MVYCSGFGALEGVLKSSVCCRAKAPPTFTTISKSEKPQDTAPRIPRPLAAPAVQPAKRPRLSPVQPVKQGGSNSAVQSSQPRDRARPPDPVSQKQPPAPVSQKPEEEPAADLAGLLGELKLLQASAWQRSQRCLVRLTIRCAPGGYASDDSS